MFSRLVLDLFVLCTNLLDVRSTISMSLMSVVANVAVGACGLMRYPSPYPVDEYFLRYVSRLDACQLAMMPVSRTLNDNVCNEEQETAYTRWWRRWKHRGGRRAPDDHTHDAFMDMTSLYSIEEAGYKAKFSVLISRLHAESLKSTEPSLSLCSGSGNVVDQSFASNHEY